MANLSDLPVVWRTVGPWKFCTRLWQQISEDNIFVWSSALAYSWLFAVFPFLIALLGVVPHLPASIRDEASETIRRFVHETLPREAAGTIMGNVNSVLQNRRNGLLSLGLLLTLFSASGGMSITMYAMDRCYDVAKGRRFYRQRPLAMLLTLVVMVGFLVVLTLLPVGTIVLTWLESRIPGLSDLAPAIHLIRYSVALLVMFGLLAIIYYFGPSIRQRFHFLSPGAIFTVLVWLGLGFVFRTYVNRFGRYDKTYGAVGGVAIMLLFFYIDAAVLLIGAEINSEIDFAVLGVPHGSKNFLREPETKTGTPDAGS
jgi:membrane protein